jgi:decaprenylphospho-beta-D-ribofuranose 2-oxidase
MALNAGGRAVLTERLDRLLGFDADSGVLVAEPGVTFGDLLDVFLPRGFIVPVTPGTAFVTLGGAVANDVHGKNHDREGSFGRHVLWLKLLVPDGTVVRCSASERPRLFTATVGGMGLTGIILEVGLQMKRVTGNAVDVRETRMSDLGAFLENLAEAATRSTYSVGWIDGTAGGRNLGRGILQTAEPACEDVATPRNRALRVPFDMPGWMLNRRSVGLFNTLYYRRVPAGGRVRRCHYRPFFYPLDGVACWPRLYGRRGFYQFQCVVPYGEEAGLRLMLEAAAAANRPPFLAVLKTLGGEGCGDLSFAMRGYTLALDFAGSDGVEAMLAQLERITLDHGGRVYLAKDSCLSAEGFCLMYPRHGQFAAVRAGVDPHGCLASDMSRRLGLYAAAQRLAA